ncbi:unnamed protein product [Polarella glacialis]|uniref:Calmodulin-lysine N-methyltransferase n=1 Tax=Polarella glacialis TaxID=89957 RepID=A0A813LZL1_POLGL|nr:unnamed protein product [Polarella glacialis]
MTSLMCEVCSGDQEQGIASYHFGMPFKRASWNPVSRTFRATASFSRDMGKYEEVVTLDGVEVEEYELVFSEDFEAIVGGECCSFFPNASKPEKCQPQKCQPKRASLSEAKLAMAAAGRGSAAVEGSFLQRRSAQDPGAVELSAAARASLALLERNGRSFRLSLESGDSVQSTAGVLGYSHCASWCHELTLYNSGSACVGILAMRGGAKRSSRWLTTPLLVAAVLLQWPEGVELCIRFGADAAWPRLRVNLCYAGPFRAKGGLALTAESRFQCLICRHILDAGVTPKAFQQLKKKAQQDVTGRDGSRHTGALQEVDGSLEGRSTRLKRSLHRAEEQPLALRYSRAPKGEGQSLQEAATFQGTSSSSTDWRTQACGDALLKAGLKVPERTVQGIFVARSLHAAQTEKCALTAFQDMPGLCMTVQQYEVERLSTPGSWIIEARLGLKPRQIRGSESASSEAYALAVLLRDTSAASPRPLLLRAEEVPLRYRTPKWFQIQRPGGLPVPLVQGCSQSGHGDVIWAAAEFCAEALVKGDLEVLVGPVRGRRVLEVGAGVGLPSCTAVRCGAQVVSSDIPDHERVLALATSLVLNLQEASAEQEMACCAPRARAVPHYWGDSCELLCSEGAFDLLLCCDCLYIPDLHGPLLDTICGCLSSAGVALVCFSLHRTAPKTVIFGFFDLARSRGLEVELFCERQLPPRCANMPLERSYVYAYTLRRGSLTESQEPVCGG